MVVSGLYGVLVVFPTHAGMADCRAELERRGGTCGELQALVEESAGSLELSLPALSSYQFVHGSFNDRHWMCPDEGSGAAQEAPSLRSRKRKGRQKLEVSVSSAPEPQSLHHEGVFQGRSTF